MHFLGYRTDRLELLKRFDVFVLPSSLEGIPRCLMEAMAARVPVVASDIPGCNDLVTSDETGLLFACGDEDALAVALNELATDPNKSDRLAANARQLIDEQYSASVMAGEYASLYAELTGNTVRRDATMRS